MGGKGEYALFSRKPFSSYKQQGAFPCADIVLAYLGASWSHAIRAPADTAMRCECKAPLPGGIHNTESRCMGAPLLPQPAVGCKTAAGKLFGSSLAAGIAATALHWLPAAASRAQLPGAGSGFTLQGMHWGFSYPGCPGDGNFTVISWNCLSKAQNRLMSGCMHRHQQWATNWRKQMENGM